MMTNCPQCGTEFSRVVTADKPPIFCSRACANKGREQTEESRAKKALKSGPAHHNFKGEWVATGKGRTRTWVWVGPAEQEAYGLKRAYMLRSRYVWNQTHPDDLVSKGEHIHHRDHDTMNDTPENLEKLTHSAHATHHFREPRGPLSDAHKASLSKAKTWLPDRPCERCGATLTRAQLGQGNRFCSTTCSYAHRSGRPQSEWAK